ncbi:hypothetical protein [Paenibacillus rigui]|uniref:hypothetical protein n=1 Tax=Paenibacillus rigui TaxID=554312 RepID=UPI0015C684ED|nr:hypothetical protein [Paenibacillus rigui]
MNDNIFRSSQLWDNLVKDVKGMEFGEERILLIGGRPVLMQIAQADDLERVNRGFICID